MKTLEKNLSLTFLNPCMLTFLALVFFISCGVSFAADKPDNKAIRVYVINVEGPVEPGMAAFLKRALTSDDDPSSIFVLKMDTFGGRVDSALEIVDLILNTPKGRTIAFVSGKAISAGALISLACNELVMKHHTTIGDCAPIMESSEGPKVMGEKFQSPLRAKFRSLAKRNNYPEVLAEAMVTDTIAVYEITMDGGTRYMDSRKYDDLTDEQKSKIKEKKTIVDKGELLTMDAVEARKFGFSRMTVASVEEMVANMGILNHEIISIGENWSEIFVRFITKISPILMMLGLAGIYIEIKSPGFGLPGLVGIIFLGLVFLGQYLVGLADHTEFLLIVAGMIFFGLEIFVLPGFGISGITGLILMGLGLLLALQDFTIPDPALPWQGRLMTRNFIQVMGASIIGLIISLAFIRYLIPKLFLVINGPYLSTSLKDAHADSLEIQRARPGERGVAITFLRPAGKVEINGELFDAISQGEFIEKGTRIHVALIQGNRMIVRAEGGE